MKFNSLGEVVSVRCKYFLLSVVTILCTSTHQSSFSCGNVLSSVLFLHFRCIRAVLLIFPILLRLYY